MYYHLNHFPLIDEKYAFEAFASVYSDNPEQSQYTDETSRKPESLLSDTSFSQSQFCKDLANYFNTTISNSTVVGYSDAIKANYLKVMPYHGIDWHHDISRNCAINVLLNDVVKCITLFRRKNKNNRVLQENWELEYELLRPVLLNTTVEHMIANYSDKPRYLLTIGFPKHVNFDDAKKFLENYVPSNKP
jgi:hypothetical protein